MKINELNQKPEVDTNIKLKEAYLQFEKLLIELRKKELPDSLVVSINAAIDELNSISACRSDSTFASVAVFGLN